jgi:hypothetical protein
MGLFGKKQPSEEVEAPSEEQELIDQLDVLQQTTEEVEAEKEAKRLAREERKFLKAIEKKRKQKERLVAPFLLVATVVVSLIMWMISSR